METIQEIIDMIEVMKRHLWMKKKKSRIMVRNLKSKQQLKQKLYNGRIYK